MVLKFAVAALAAVAASASPSVVTTLDTSFLAKLDEIKHEGFNLYINEYSKTYTGAEKAEAFKNWLVNEDIINVHNAGDSSYTLGHNEYSDMSSEAFSAQMLGGFDGEAYLNREKNYDYTLNNNLRGANATATAMDWVTKGAVTPVKNQAQCGSCWAFSTTGSIEGAYQIATGTLLSLSEQDLVSCDNAAHGGSDQGCNGGLMDNAFGWIKTNGICSEADYPYSSGQGTTGTCETTCTPEVTLTGHTDVPKGDEKSLLSAATIGPVSVAIEADKSAFQLYKSGVLDSPDCGTQLDHGVLIVGYGTDSTLSKDYWKVKNSWGATWGEKGYLRMVRNKDMCGIADSASYPTGVKQMAPGPAPGPSPGPAPGPSPGPAPAPAGTTHYGDPNTGACMTDEVKIQIQNVAGAVCSPVCTGLFKTKCPKDVPTGVTAKPTCALQDASSGSKYCALICSATTDEASLRAGDAMCGTASCKAISGTGICTYDN